MVSKYFYIPEYLDEFLFPICELAISNKINSVTIPLLEESNVSDKKNRDRFINTFKPLLEKFKTLNFLIEAELSHDKLKLFLNELPNVSITYDTGNITSCGFDHEEYISHFTSDIKQVHIKDRTKIPLQTTPPTKGDTDFKLIFTLLKSVGFDGPYTLQTAREENGSEIETITKHKQLIEKIYHECDQFI